MVTIKPIYELFLDRASSTSPALRDATLSHWRKRFCLNFCKICRWPISAMVHLDIKEPQLTVTRSKMMKARIMFCSSVIIMFIDMTLTWFEFELVATEACESQGYNIVNHKNYNSFDCDWLEKSCFPPIICEVFIRQFVIGQFLWQFNKPITFKVVSCSFNRPFSVLEQH